MILRTFWSSSIGCAGLQASSRINEQQIGFIMNGCPNRTEHHGRWIALLLGLDTTPMITALSPNSIAEPSKARKVSAAADRRL